MERSRLILADRGRTPALVASTSAGEREESIMEHVYSVTANTTKGGVKLRRIIVIANNQSEAKAIARDEWDRQGGDCHLFRLAAHRTDTSPTNFNTLWHITDVKTSSGNWITYV